VEKVVHVLWGDREPRPAAGLGPALVAAGGRHVVTFDVDPEGDARYAGPGPIDSALGPFAGIVESWLDCVDDVAPISALVRADGPAHGYLVTESVPRRATALAGPGEPTPGWTLLTVLDRPEHLDEATFLRNWTEGHTPLALRYTPLTSYVRNHVVRPLADGAPRLAGMVSEQVAVLEDMVDRARWVGAGDDPDLASERYAELRADVRAFLDHRRVEAHCAIERRW
jgi:hypothetical protein